MVDVVVRRLTGMVDEDNAVEVIAQPEDETHDDERDRYSKVVEAYFRSAVILRHNNCAQIIVQVEENIWQNKIRIIENITPDNLYVGWRSNH